MDYSKLTPEEIQELKASAQEVTSKIRHVLQTEFPDFNFLMIGIRKPDATNQVLPNFSSLIVDGDLDMNIASHFLAVGSQMPVLIKDMLRAAPGANMCECPKCQTKRAAEEVGVTVPMGPMGEA